MLNNKMGLRHRLWLVQHRERTNGNRTQERRQRLHNGHHGVNGHDAFSNGRWDGIIRPYASEEVQRLRGSVKIEYTLADLGARRLWEL